MKRLTILSIIIILILAVGCQPTPDDSVVAPKNIEQIVIQAQENTEEGADIHESIKAELYNDTFTSGNGKTVFNISATIDIPDVESLSIQRVTKHVFSQEEASQMIETFLGDVKLYQIPVSLDQKQIEEKLILYYGMRDGSIPIFVDGEDSTSIERLNELIADYEKALLSAEDAPGQLEASLIFSTPSDSTDPASQKIEGVSINANGDIYLCINNCYPQPNIVRAIYVNAKARDGFLYNRNAPYYDIRDTEDPIVPASFNLSQDEALQFANNLLADLEISGMQCAQIRYVVMPSNTSNTWPGITYTSENAQAFKWAYKLQFTRLAGGVPITITSANGTGVTDETLYALPWEYEKLEIIVDTAGLVCFEYRSPYEIVETITTNASILPFEDIASVAKVMLPATYGWIDESSEMKSASIEISRISLGMMRVTEPNARDHGLLIPVWDLWGSLTTTNNNGEQSVFYEFESLLTINALDGTVINRQLGY